MSILAIRGNWEKKYFRKTASVVFRPNTLVSQNTDEDTVKAADSSDTLLIGVCMSQVNSASSDYADNTRIVVMVPADATAEMLCDTNADIALTDEGEEHDVSDSSVVDPALSTNDQLKLKQFVAARRGYYTINKKEYV